MIPNFKYFYNHKAENLEVILPGISQGMDSGFINKIIEVCWSKGDSVVTFNFPFFERGKENSSGPELIEEIEALRVVLDYCQSDNYRNIILIGKSLGGVVAGAYLKKLSPEQKRKFSLVIFGYDIGYIDIKDFSGKIIIVQGSEDKFGDVEAVKKDMHGATSKCVTYLSVEDADHSYRIPETKEPFYEDEAIKTAFKQIK